MPVSDPSSGRTFIWLITCILFISILTGGGCLMAYLFLPESQVPYWVPVLGVVLVCVPWAFWFFTFIYRVFSRWCGCRVRVGVGGNGGGNENAIGNENVKGEAQSNNGRDIDRNSSVASHESEMPLAKSMAT